MLDGCGGQARLEVPCPVSEPLYLRLAKGKLLEVESAELLLLLLEKPAEELGLLVQHQVQD